LTTEAKGPAGEPVPLNPEAKVPNGEPLESGAALDGDTPQVAPPPVDEEEPAVALQDDVKLLVETARFATPARVQAVVEALLFAAEKPIPLATLADTTHFSPEQLDSALAALRLRYAAGEAGIVLADLGGRWQLRTDAQVGPYVRRLLQVKPMRLTRAAMETLAMVAYRQPITRPELEDLRGVDCGAVTKALLERKLIRILGKKDEPGRPILYGTSREFLELFNLRDLTQLPTLREFQELSEESRKIVEEEAPGAPAISGLTDLARDPAVETKLQEATHESDAALDQLEKAMAVAEERAKTAAAVLAPPEGPKPSPADGSTGPAGSTEPGPLQSVPPPPGSSHPGESQTRQAGGHPAAGGETETGSEGDR
jgi:segregation and condensation protein B